MAYTQPVRTASRQPPGRRIGVALALVALAGAGCGSTTPSPTVTHGSSAGAPTASSAREKPLRFARCMRDHGVSAFPDPDASGQLTLDGIANGSSLDTGTAAFTSALAACRDLEPSGFTGHKRGTKQQSTALRFAQCVREHGVKDFPDPAPGDPLVDTNRIPSSNEPGGMTILNAAMQECHSVVAGLLGGQ